MNKVLQDKLFNDFPFLYQESNMSIKDSCMGRGFEVDDGWFGVIYLISWEIEHRYNKFLMNEDYYAWIDGDDKIRKEIIDRYKNKDLVVAKQVKQKFGTLRFYYATINSDSFRNEFVNDTLEELCNLASTTCEKCGRSNAKKMDNGRGWLITVCEKCNSKSKEKK